MVLQSVAAARRSTIEADGVVVTGEAIELQPEHVRRDLGDLFDGGAAGHAERVGNSRALRGAGEIDVGARPHDRRSAHRRDADRRRVAAAEQFDVAGRQRRHHAIARHQFDGIERRPIAPDAGVVLARAAVGIFEGEMRQAAARAAAQIIDGRISAGRARRSADWRCCRSKASPCGAAIAVVSCMSVFSRRHYSRFSPKS